MSLGFSCSLLCCNSFPFKESSKLKIKKNDTKMIFLLIETHLMMGKVLLMDKVLRNNSTMKCLDGEEALWKTPWKLLASHRGSLSASVNRWRGWGLGGYHWNKR